MLSPSDTCPCRCLCANVCSGKSIELERTFLAKFIPDEIADVSPKRIVDVYYPEFGHAELRLRQNGDSYEITKKIPLQGGSDKIKKMQELTIPLTEAEFSALVISGHRKIVKDRYNVDVGGYQIICMTERCNVLFPVSPLVMSSTVPSAFMRAASVGLFAGTSRLALPDGSMSQS